MATIVEEFIRECAKAGIGEQSDSVFETEDDGICADLDATLPDALRAFVTALQVGNTSKERLKSLTVRLNAGMGSLTINTRTSASNSLRSPVTAGIKTERDGTFVDVDALGRLVDAISIACAKNSSKLRLLNLQGFPFHRVRDSAVRFIDTLRMCGTALDMICFNRSRLGDQLFNKLFAPGSSCTRSLASLYCSECGLSDYCAGSVVQLIQDRSGAPAEQGRAERDWMTSLRSTRPPANLARTTGRVGDVSGVGLEVLDLSGNSLSDAMLLKLVPALKSSNSLLSLNISQNIITTVGLNEFLLKAELFDSSLDVLDFSNNAVNPSKVIPLPTVSAGKAATQNRRARRFGDRPPLVRTAGEDEHSLIYARGEFAKNDVVVNASFAASRERNSGSQPGGKGDMNESMHKVPSSREVRRERKMTSAPTMIVNNQSFASKAGSAASKKRGSVARKSDFGKHLSGSKRPSVLRPVQTPDSRQQSPPPTLQRQQEQHPPGNPPPQPTTVMTSTPFDEVPPPLPTAPMPSFPFGAPFPIPSAAGSMQNPAMQGGMPNSAYPIAYLPVCVAVGPNGWPFFAPPAVQSPIATVAAAAGAVPSSPNVQCAPTPSNQVAENSGDVINRERERKEDEEQVELARESAEADRNNNLLAEPVLGKEEETHADPTGELVTSLPAAEEERFLQSLVVRLESHETMTTEALERHAKAMRAEIANLKTSLVKELTTIIAAKVTAADDAREERLRAELEAHLESSRRATHPESELADDLLGLIEDGIAHIHRQLMPADTEKKGGTQGGPTSALVSRTTTTGAPPHGRPTPGESMTEFTSRVSGRLRMMGW